MVAAECVRKKLAPLALNAYPEAYAEFKRALLLLVYSQHEDVSPVASEWSARTRADLAAILSRTLRQAAGALPLSCNQSSLIACIRTCADIQPRQAYGCWRGKVTLAAM